MKQLPEIIAGKRKWLFARLLLNGVAQAGVMITTAWLIKLIFDKYVMSNSLTNGITLVWCGIGLVVAALAIALLRMWERIDAERMGQDYTHEVRTGLFAHMCQLSPRTMQTRSRGGVMLRFIGDLTALKQWVSLGLARLSVASITTAVTLAILAFISAPLALLVAIILIVGAVSVFFLGDWLQRAVREVRRRRANLASNVNEKVAALAVMQAFGQTQREQKRVFRQSKKVMNAMVNRARAVGAFRGVIELVTAIASGGVLLLGVILVSQGGATPGTIVAAMSIVGLLVPALRDLGRVKEYWHGAVVSREKISDFIAMQVVKEIPQSAIFLESGPATLQFEHVTIPGAIHNFNATVEPGQVIALVGPNGAGKSTLLSLAARLIDPHQGAIRINGQDITMIENKSLRSMIGIMTSDLPLLRGRLEHNLKYRWPEASDEAVARVRKLCGINELLEDLPQGIQTRLSEDGVNLSLGQRQRIGLARAILGEPGILLLDEVDANLDPFAAAALHNVLTEYKGTVLMVTHRIDWLKLADVVWHIQQGCLVESGTPETLLNSNGPTAKLFQSPKVVGL